MERPQAPDPELQEQAGAGGCYVSFDTYLETKGVDFLTRDERRTSYALWRKFYIEYGGSLEGLVKIKKAFEQQLCRLPKRKKDFQKEK